MKLQNIKKLITFDLKWMIIHLFLEPINEIKEVFTNTKHSLLKQERPKELRRLFFMMFVVFALTDRQDIMTVGVIGFFISHIAYVYSSGKHIRTMRKLTKNKIGVDYGTK